MTKKQTIPRSYTDEWHDMVAAGKIQREALEKCQRERDDAWLALRAIIGIIEDETRIYVPQFIGREYEVLAIAKKALEEAE